ncbi:MAG: Uma2 family endonuclease [Bacteroidia bacterium]|nr:Uma2 family endonuclease [Bacteroidia bacterium]
MLTGTKHKKQTYEDYLQTPEGAGYQLLNGNLVCEPDAPYTNHQLIIMNLVKLIGLFVWPDKKGTLLVAPTDVYFDDENTVQPDILFISKERKHIIKEKFIEGAPDLVIEVVSQSTFQRDTIEKKHLYERFGVKEYWLVFPEENRIEVFVLNQNRFGDANTVKQHGKVQSIVLQGIDIAVNRIFLEHI